MKKKILLISIVILLFAASGAMIFWYFRGVRQTEKNLERAVEKATKPAPKEVAIKIYFGNKDMNPSGNCTDVFPVKRVVLNDLIIRRRAVEELLRGPTQSEKEQGYYSGIPDRDEIISYREKIRQETGQVPYEGDEIKIKSFKILAGVAYIDFSKEMMAYGEGSGSCRVDTIKAQIIETVKQFPKVGHAVISIEGDQHALQP